LYGAFGVKRRTIISTSFFRPIPLFDRGDHPFVSTCASFTSARAGAVKVGRRTNLAELLRLCQATPGQLRARRHAWRDRDDDQRGARFRTRSIAPQPCIRWVQEPDHDAAMRIGSEAPRRRTHSPFRHESHGNTSGPRHLEPSSATPSQVDGLGRNWWVPSASSVHDAGRRTTPSGTTPSRTNRHKAIRSLRAKATTMGLRVPRAFLVRV